MKKNMKNTCLNFKNEIIIKNSEYDSHEKTMIEIHQMMAQSRKKSKVLLYQEYNKIISDKEKQIENLLINEIKLQEEIGNLNELIGQQKVHINNLCNDNDSNKKALRIVETTNENLNLKLMETLNTLTIERQNQKNTKKRIKKIDK